MSEQAQADQSLFTPTQVADLTGSAIEIGFAWEYGVRSVREVDELPEGAPAWWAGFLPGMLFPYKGADGRIEPQLKPDVPKALDFGQDPPKYLFRTKAEGYKTTPWVLVRPNGGHPVIFVEGAKKALAVLAVRPVGWGVIALSSCTGGAIGGVGAKELRIARGRDTYVCMDGDYETNLDVWNASRELFEHIRLESPTRLKMVRLPKSTKAKIDDLLAAREEGDRRRFLWALVESAAEENFPASRKPKSLSRITGAGEDESLEVRLFPTGVLDAQAAAAELVKRVPMALLSPSGPVAMYSGGVYKVGESALRVATSRLLGGRYRRSYVDSIEDFLLGMLESNVIPEQTGTSWLNVANGLLNLDTGEFRDHGPDVITTVQLPIEWDPSAQCPRYEAWLEAAVGADQMDGLEEGAAAMLDQRLPPEKALMLFGPSRTGKGTYIRLLEALAGTARSAVTLHQLAEDKFAAAELRGSILNSAAEISSRELRDTATFKQMTGRDLVMANQKYGRQFTFRNQALFVFACNRLPVVHETSNAYLNRVTPVHFGVTFEGKQDPRIEAGLMEELPGILKRLVLALARRRKRGGDAPIPAKIQRGFEVGSNSVREWVALCCNVEADPVDGASMTSLHMVYSGWCELTGRRPLGQRSMAEVMHSMDTSDGIRQGRTKNRTRAWNLRVLPASEWEEALSMDKDEGDEENEAIARAVVAEDKGLAGWTSGGGVGAPS